MGNHFVFGLGFSLLDSEQYLHCDKADAGFVTGLDGLLHFAILHKGDVVAGHNGVDPAKLRRSQQAFSHIFVCAKTKETNELAFLCALGPFSQLLCELQIRVVTGVNTKVQVNVIGVHSF